jgi:hypothetical protein
MDEYADAGETMPVDDTAAMQAEPSMQPPDDKALVEKLCKRIEADRKKRKKTFDRMRENQQLVRRGAPENWPEDAYVVNIIGRHIAQKAAALYAKNPKPSARRAQRLDFTLWDETQDSLMMAVQMATQWQAMSATMPPVGIDPMTGAPVPAPPPPAIQQAQAILEDYRQGIEHRQMMDKIGRTQEILFQHFMDGQTPLPFKTSMKGLVRRALTCKVGFVEIGFQREFSEDMSIAQRLADFQRQIAYLKNLAAEVAEGSQECADYEAKSAELEHAMRSMSEQQFVLMREGLTFDFLASTAVIPDSICRSLVGFEGSRWLTVEYPYTASRVKEVFGVDLGSKYNAYTADGKSMDGHSSTSSDDDDNREDYVCVWKHYDRQSGTVYVLCDGYDGFLRPPGPPEVYVEDFWPIEALTFNEIEDEKDIYPPSDVELMYHMQMEYNRAREGMREHRKAARPRFVIPRGAMTDEEKTAFSKMEPFDVTEINLNGVDNDVGKAMQAIRVPGVDPNLYETNPIFVDTQLAVGSAEAQFGSAAGATATESSIAESSRIASVDSNVDDLDGFLTRVARKAGQILLREMSPEQVTKIVGPGAVWPQLTLDQIADELVLEIEAGSSGKPNRVQELRNWREILPFVIQIPGINPEWLGRETLRRLDDRMDLTDAFKQNLPAIVSMNRQSGAAPAPGAMPEDQGGAGADNASVPGGPTGSDAALGNNQQAIM